MSQRNSPVVMLVAESFGLSIRESGNAVMAAEPNNFYRMWANEPHLLLTAKISKRNLLSDRSGGLVRLSTGRSLAPEKDYYKEMISGGVFGRAQTKQFLDDVQIHNSALHLFATVSDLYENSDSLDVVEKLIGEAKSHGLYRVFVHLLLVEALSVSKQRAQLKDFASQIEQKTSAEIASIAGMATIYGGGSQALSLEAFSALIGGTGQRAISLEQAVRMIPESFESCPVVSIVHRRGFSGKIDEFDSVLFCDYDLSSLAPVIEQLSNPKKRSPQAKIPRFVSVATLFDSADVDAADAKVLVPGYYSETLPQVLFQNDVAFKIIADASCIKAVKQYLVSSEKISENEKYFRSPFFDKKSPVAEYKSVFLEILKYLREDKLPQFIYVHLPLISHAISQGNFSDAVLAVKMVNDFLPLVTKAVWAQGGTFVFTSSHSGAEQMLSRSKEEIHNNKTFNPVPFVYAAGDHSYSSGIGSEVISEKFFDMMKVAGRDIDILPTILDVLGITIPGSVEGHSLMHVLQNKKES